MISGRSRSDKAVHQLTSAPCRCSDPAGSQETAVRHSCGARKNGRRSPAEPAAAHRTAADSRVDPEPITTASRVLEVEPPAVRRLREDPDPFGERQLRKMHPVGVALTDAEP